MTPTIVTPVPVLDRQDQPVNGLFGVLLTLRAWHGSMPCHAQHRIIAVIMGMS